MGAAAQQDRSRGVEAETAQEIERRGRQRHLARIVFDASDVMNPLARNSESDPAFHIFRLLDADGIETTKSRRDQKTKSLEPRFRAVGEARVYEGERNPPIPRLRSQVRPDFRFDENDSDGPNEGERAAHDRPEIERAVEYFDLRVRFGVRDLESGRRRRGQHAKEPRIELP